MTRIPGPVRQRGVALFLVLILLIAMSWFALSGFRISGQHLQIVGNNQVRSQTLASAQRAIEQTISSNAFTTNPAAVASVPIHTDIDGDGYDDFTAMLTPAPRCYRVRPIKTAELNVALWSDRQCLVSSGGGGIYVERPGAAPAGGDSLCSNSEWNISAVASDAQSGAAVTVNQGVGIRVAAADAATFCK
jgi:hypothetical protein